MQTRDRYKFRNWKGPGSAAHHFASLRAAPHPGHKKTRPIGRVFIFPNARDNQNFRNGLFLLGRSNGPGSADWLRPKAVLSSTPVAEWFGRKA